MMPLDLPNIKMRMFPIESPMNIGGALTHNSEFYRPSATDGPLIYLNGNPDLRKVVDKIEGAGVKLLAIG